MERWLISVGAGRWQLPGMQSARAAGLRVLAIDGDAQAPGLSAADMALVVDIREADSVIRAVRTSGIAPAGVIAFCNEAGMRTTAALREAFDLPGARSAVTASLTNKGIQRQRWTAAGLPGPGWAVARSAEDVSAVLGELPGDVIFKPVDSAGSRGITVVKTGEPWRSAFEKAMAGSRCREVIVEQFIVGREHTVETFTHRGRTHVLAITAKKKVEGTSNTVASELASAQFDDAATAKIGEICTRALSALGYVDGPGHTELLMTDGGEFYLVESAGRGGGFMVADGVVPGASGYDLATACALQAVGLEPPVPDFQNRREVVLRFLPSTPGTVARIRGFGAEDEVPGVRSEPMVSEGQKIGPAASDGDRMAFILSIADTLEEALRRAWVREQKIAIEVVP